jgi:hypothetical protein
MRSIIILIVVAAAMGCGAQHASADELIRLTQAAQTAGTQQVSPSTPGLSTPVTSTVTNCMMSCNSQASNCQTGCYIPAPPIGSPTSGPFVPYTAPILNSTVNPTCTSTQLACQTNCARQSSIQGQ